MKETKPHSAEYFGEQRDFWWNQDFLQLMAARWDLSSKTNVLDVGCGIGHWHKLLSPFLAKDATITALDREQTWVEKAKETAPQSKQTFKFLQGDADKLPFADNTFDMVTCQTVLIHMKDPVKTIAEWIRVLKPGGLLAVAEPNNIAANAVRSSRDFEAPIPTLLEKISFMMTCERGKWNLGEGHNSIGDLLPGFFSQCGLHDVKVFISDKASPWIPPYNTAKEKAMIAHWMDWIQREMGPWSEEETQRYFIAGGGKPEDFKEQRGQWLKNFKAGMDEVKALRFHTAGGVLQYLISGQKN